ncbi:MAG: UDP-2,3-diacylglucosamine diphosphatase [Comamonadaceae bacterium]
MSVLASPVLLQVPAHWQRLDFIADLHLQPGDEATFRVWRDFMQQTQADAVFILGDLFEVWVGDDAIHAASHGDDFAARCAQVLAAAAQRLAIFFMHGNRDFLIGTAFAAACNMQLLDDPTVLEFAGERWLLSHGDALCLQDSDYMQFRSLVRSKQWRQTFLDQPLAKRQEIGRQMRSQSEAHKRKGMAKGDMLVDLDSQATCECLQASAASTLIHGHTHKPGEHDLGQGLRRIVLSDWDASASPPRASILRLSATQSRDAPALASLARLPATLA